MSTHSALVGIPDAVHALVPELGRLPLPGESLADCNACSMAPAQVGTAAAHRAFQPEARCCTYHPTIINFAVGHGLVEGGTAARLFRERLRRRAGVSALGIRAWDAFRQRYADRVHTGGFGRDLALRCPYWRGGELACGVWTHRNPVCRTWHCRHEQGPRGRDLWVALRDTLRRAEFLLAEELIRRGRPPSAEAGERRWVAWYQWCARKVDSLDPDTLGTLGADDELVHHRAMLRARERIRPLPLPDKVGPSVQDVEKTPDGARLTGYSFYDWHDAPPWIFPFLSKLDGETPWRDARDATETELGTTIENAAIAELWRVGVIAERSGKEEKKPGVSARVRHSDGRTWTMSAKDLGVNPVLD